VLMVFALMSLTLIAAPLAGAQTAVRGEGSNFMPLTSPAAAGPVYDKDQLSDAFDGVDSTAHLTAVGNQNTTGVYWYVCSLASSGSPTASTCTEIGSDTTGTARNASGGNTTTDVAYELNYNVPQTFDEQEFDIVTAFCNGTPSLSGGFASGGTGCELEREDAIYLDDAGSADAAGIPPFGTGENVPTGEIMGFCVSTTTACPSTSTAFRTDGHGSLAPTDATWVFRTSANVNGASMCVDEGADNDTEPSTCDFSVQATLVNTTSTYKEWNALVTGRTAGADADFAIGGQSTTDEARDAECTGGLNFVTPTTATGDTCTLDEHYKLLAAPAANSGEATAALTFQTAGSTCTSQDEAESNRNGQVETVLGCLTDQFGRAIDNQSVSFSTSGTAGYITACGPGSAGTGGTTTPTGFGQTSTACTTVTNGSGQANATLHNSPTATQTNAGQLEGNPGTQTVTFCAGSQATGSTGCLSGAPTDTVTKTWLGLPAEVTLVFAGTGDEADPCNTGDQFKTNEEGDTDTLLACVMNQDGVLTPTVMTGEGASVWRIRWENSSASTVAFGENPPNETGDDGTATLDIIAVNEGSSTIEVFLTNNGGDEDSAQVVKTVTEGPGSQQQCNNGIDDDSDGDIDYPNDAGCTSINDNTEASENQPGDTTGTACQNKENDPNVIVGTDGADVLQGTANRDIICGLGGDDVISGRAGNDLIQGNAGSDTIGGGGGKDNVSGNGGKDNVSGNKGNDAVKGAGKGDTLKGNGGIDSITGGAGSDSLQGGDGPDILKGGPGDDTLRGGAGDDALNGGGGTDQCFGNAGNDSVTGCE
jgi:hypothetical protein